MITWIYAGTASMLILATGLIHGWWTDRWTRSEDTQAAAMRLLEIPTQIGDWEGSPIERSGSGAPGVTGSLQRIYTHRLTNARVVIALVNGRPGPVATHTPEACYGASGYVLGAKKAVEIANATGLPAQFWTADATRTRASEQTKIRLYWAWSVGQGWVASQEARRDFPRFRHSILHKLYVIRDLNTPTAGNVEPCEAFLHDFIEVMQSTLFKG
jgi:hypothetical protein